MFDLGKLAFDLVSQLILGVIQDGLKSSTLDFFEKRKIERRVEDATADVVQRIIPFLEQEKISRDKQQRLIETCVSELKPFADNPAELFKGSLDGQKIFDSLYHDKGLPQVIVEDGLQDIYSLLFPQIATLLCKIPAVVRDWENEAWSENYRRFDEVVAQLKALFAQVNELAANPQIHVINHPLLINYPPSMESENVLGKLVHEVIFHGNTTDCMTVIKQAREQTAPPLFFPRLFVLPDNKRNAIHLCEGPREPGGPVSIYGTIEVIPCPGNLSKVCIYSDSLEDDADKWMLDRWGAIRAELENDGWKFTNVVA